jgi:peptidoglycan hydrolase-like protein with peptidoglycan-binding domain
MTRLGKQSVLLSIVLCAAIITPAASAAGYGSRTLKIGTRGGDVKQLQRYLRRAGNRIAVDGDFGPRTRHALRATEKPLELRVDSVASRRDQSMIRRAVSVMGTGGARYAPPPPPTKVVAGPSGKVTTSGYAVAPASAPAAVKAVIAAGNKIAKTPYKWGGGHPAWADTGYDCSGSVSFALHGASLLNSALVSGDFGHWGEPGAGRWITVYSNSQHVYMTVADMRFDTSARAQTGSRWTMRSRSSRGFAVTHPPGL